MKAVGFDFGSVYTRGVLLENEKITSFRLYRRKGPDDLDAVAAFFREIGQRFPGEKFRLGITGIASNTRPPEQVIVSNPVSAVASGARFLGFTGQNIIEIGGQNSKLIVLDAGTGNIKEFAMNDACAAGSGMFIEQQAGRLQVSIDEFSRLADAGERNVAIAGRCAVFAKSDMIHMQQKGVKVADLASGLCKAIIRNCQAMLLKGRDLDPPVMLAGGCAANSGIVKAFRDIHPGMGAGNVFVSPFPGLEGAIGAAVIASRSQVEELTAEAVLKLLFELTANSHKESATLAPLKKLPFKKVFEPETGSDVPVEGYLGIDVGSVSTDLAVLDREGELISSVYLPTRGKPVEVLREGLAIIKGRFNGGLKVLGCGSTGSGRHLAGKILGADIVKNEITCQFLGVQHYLPDVDTIFEIGGQDSKFISVRNGSIEDFLMNKVCAAGTGSFLEEQAGEMGISIFGEFEELAFASSAPVDLGSHCTVFMETEIVGAMQQGKPLADICAGLAYSIVRNYLEKVVGSRPIGRRIAFQGGVASNAAVRAAFEQILQKPVVVMPYNRVSGAIGAAIAARNHIADRPSVFRGLDCTDDAVITTFHCSKCSNNCEVSLIEQGGEKIFYGDTCERYTSTGGLAAAECSLPNLAAEYIKGCEAYFTGREPGPVIIGVPRASTLVGYLPFWATFFAEIGCTPLLSDSTTENTLAQGLKYLPSSVCLPVKLMAGHVASLQAWKPEFIFLPSIMHLQGDDPEHSYACPYAMALPFMINIRSRVRFLSPVISLNDENAFAEGFAPCLADLKVSEEKVKAAYRAAMLENKQFHERMRRRAAELIAGSDYSYVFAVIGKPYNLFDQYLNMGLFERLRRSGVLAVPLPMLPLDLGGIVCQLPWELSARIFQAAAACAGTDNIFPLLTSNYGCAPDAFTFRQLEPLLSNKPHLLVEFDEHRGEAGLVTRLEAFLDQLENAGKPVIEMPEPARRPVSVALVPKLNAKVCMPYWSDYVFAFAGIWEHHGYRVEILPVPDQSVRILGEKHSLGKECSPYAMIVGDLMQLHQKNPVGELIYHFPGVTFPCLLNQYGNSIQVLIKDLGISNIRLSSLNGSELARAFGIAEMQVLYEGLLAIDVLVKAACEIRPYEKTAGMTGELHHQNLLRIREGIARGNVLPGLDESLRALMAVPVDRSRKRPLVGIAGDLYTKVNEVANNNLFKWLEEQGFEVWPSPSQVDLLDCSIYSSFRQSLAKFEFARIIENGMVALRAMLGAWKVRNAVGKRVVHLEEPGYNDILRLAQPYMNNSQHELLLVNIAKIMDFVERGAHGVINAICFNCMVGNASAAIIEKIRQDHSLIPIITAVYSGSENPGRQMQLEAFASQVKDRFEISNSNSRSQYCGL